MKGSSQNYTLVINVFKNCSSRGLTRVRVMFQHSRVRNLGMKQQFTYFETVINEVAHDFAAEFDCSFVFADFSAFAANGAQRSMGEFETRSFSRRILIFLSLSGFPDFGFKRVSMFALKNSKNPASAPG